MPWVHQTDGTVCITSRSHGDPEDWIYYDDLNRARNAGRAIKTRCENEKKLEQMLKNAPRTSSDSSSNDSSIGGILSILALPFKLIFWICKTIFFTLPRFLYRMCKKIFFLFKSMFYIFPRFLWKKGIAGKIACGIYILVWVFTILVIIMYIRSANMWR